MSSNFFLIAGPCAIEEEGLTMQIASKLKEITNERQIPFVFKASYRKANRTKLDSFQSYNDDAAGLRFLGKLSTELNIPVTTDVHEEYEASAAQGFVDILQIPAFLCRQTNLLLAAGKTKRIVNLKKGQFASAETMKHAVDKVRSTGNENIILTERGTTFGYQDLIVDFRNIPIMKSFGVPVVVDITHSVQKPNQNDGTTSGNREFIEILGKAAIAVGADGIFLETHPEPQKSKSDKDCMLPLDQIPDLLDALEKIKC